MMSCWKPVYRSQGRGCKQMLVHAPPHRQVARFGRFLPTENPGKSVKIV
jgi:hypothetical protein